MSPFNSNRYLETPTMKMPIVGLGTWQATEEQVDQALNAAIDTGYRHIDTAFAYLNEAAIGKSLKKIFENGKVKREEMFIVTKLPGIANDAKYVEDYIKRSLSALQLDYIDLYLIHHPCGLVNGEDLMPKDENGEVKLDMTTDHVAIWKKMEEQVDAGRAKAIGLSNFNIKQIERIMASACIKPANLQVELHIYCQQKELREFCKKNGITICDVCEVGQHDIAPPNKIVINR